MNKRLIEIAIVHIAILSLFVFIGIASAASARTIDEKYLSTELLKESRTALSEERQLLEKQAERHFSHLDNFINRVIWGAGLLATVAIALAVWGFGRTRSEMQKTVHDLFEREAKSLIESEATQLRQKLKDLKAQVDDLAAYRERKVTWVFPGETIDGQMELEVLYSMGLKNIQIITPLTTETIDIGSPDLVIFSYDGTENGRRLLKSIVEKLKSVTPPVFFIIYTYDKNGKDIRINKEDLAGFHWYVPANFPSQLVLQTQLLIRRGRSTLGGDPNGQL